jgi:hypothetical protein
MKVSAITAYVTCASVVLGAANAADVAQAFWHGARSPNWNDGISAGKSNWYSQRPPNGAVRPVPKDTAIFSAGAQGAAGLFRQERDPRDQVQGGNPQLAAGPGG